MSIPVFPLFPGSPLSPGIPGAPSDPFKPGNPSIPGGPDKVKEYFFLMFCLFPAEDQTLKDRSYFQVMIITGPC